MKIHPWNPDISTVVSWIDSRTIDLQPDYQRGDVWPTPKKKRLIDTILRGWSVPPVHVVVQGNTHTLEVLDGQQRLTAIRDFVHNKFPIDGHVEPHDPSILSLDKMRYSQLPEITRRQFNQYCLHINRITDYAPPEPGELFYRLNQPTSLTAGEHRNSLYGPARHQLKMLVTMFMDMGNNKDTIGFTNSRMAFDDVISKVLFVLERNSLETKLRENIVSERFKTAREFSQDVIEACEKSIDLFSRSRPGNKIRFNKATVFSWLIFLSRFNQELDTSFMEEFECRRAVAEIIDDVESRALYVFNDRASLRVSDVSSVLLRDFILFVFYYSGGRRALPHPVPANFIDAAWHKIAKGTTPPETVLEEAIHASEWGKVL